MWQRRVEAEVRSKYPQRPDESESSYEDRIAYEVETLLEAFSDERWMERIARRTATHYVELDQQGFDWIDEETLYEMETPPEILDRRDEHDLELGEKFLEDQLGLLDASQREMYRRYMASANWRLKN
jgi:hypothetical protein